MALNRPSVGSIVHYVLDNGQHRPAIVVRKIHATPGIMNDVSLHVFIDREVDKLPTDGTSVVPHFLWRHPVSYSETFENGTWHWPE